MFFPIIYNNDFISIIKVENVGNTWGETLGLCFKKVNLSNLKPTNFIFGVGVFVCYQVCFYESKVVCSPCSLPPFVSVACFKCFWYCSGESPTCGPAQCDKNEPVALQAPPWNERISPLKIGEGPPKEHFIFQPSIFRGYLCFREGIPSGGSCSV